MAIHEIGYLIVSSTFQCLFWGTLNPCPNAEKIQVAGMTQEKVSEYETREVQYEESGFAVFGRKNDEFEIRKKTGEKIHLRLTDLNRQTQDALPKTTSAEEQKSLLWRFKPLEEILKNAMISREADFLSLLRKDDLKSPLVIPLEQLQIVRQSRIDKLLKDQQLSLPVGYILTTSPCTYQKITANMSTGSCASPGTAPAYAKPDHTSEIVLDAAFSWAHLEGRPLQTSQLNPPEKSDQLLVFEEQGDWVRVKLVVLDKSKRIVWIHKKDIPYKIIRLNPADQLKTLIDFLNTTSKIQSEEDINLAKNLKTLTDKPLELDLDFAGETKWSEGVLWVKVNIRSEPHCAADEAKIVFTGWVPYVDPKTKKKILGWYSRGC